MFSRNYTCIVLFLLCTFLQAQKKSGTTKDQAPINDPNNKPGNYDQERINQVYAIADQVEQTQNFINLGNLSPDSNVALPFGIIKDIGAVRYIICVDSLKFKSQGAYFSAFAAIDLPGSGKRIAFRGSNIKFNPAGVVGGNQARLYLASSHVIQINPTVRMRLLDNGQNWVEWDCNGFKAINLVGNFEFSKSKLLPDTSIVPKDTIVKASFQIYTQDIHNFITTLNISPFCIAGLKGWGFKVSNASVDMSELANHPGFSFPPDYPMQNLPALESWTGFSLKSLTIRLPKEISKTGKKTEITASNMLIDNMGVSGFFQVNNLIALNEGSMSGWAFSVEEIGAGFVTNRINHGHLKGKIQVPITSSNETFNYTADVHHSYTSGKTNYNFVVAPANNITLAVFSAKVNLNNNSSIAVTVVDGNFKPSAILNGQISFDTPKMSSKGGYLAFENLTIVTVAPYITDGIFSLHSITEGQAKAHNYPLTFNEIRFGFDQGAPILGFSVTLNLSEQTSNPISIGTAVHLKGKIDATPQTYTGEYPVTHTKTNWQFDRVVMTGFSIDLKTSPFTLKGTILFKEDDPIYGNGFMGGLKMGITNVIPESEVNVCFGSKPNFKYFYLDTRIPVNIQLGSMPITITKLIGGFFYHMKPNMSSQAELIALNKNYSGSSNALSYTPDINSSIGLKAGLSYKFTPNESPLNGDLMLDINFTSSGGLGAVKLLGDVYSMSTIAQRNKAPIKGTVAIDYDVPNKTFDAIASTTINAYNAITGTGSFKIHFDPQCWYLCVGRPNAPNNISFFNLVNVPSYFMVGNTLESPTALPSSIANNSNFTSIFGKRDENQLKNASGFCAGSRIRSNMDRSFGPSILNVRAIYNFEMGWDMMMANYGENAHCQNSDTKVGMNGWLAEGQMFLAMNGEVSINGNFKFPSNCPSETVIHPFCGEGHRLCITVKTICLFDIGFSEKILGGELNAVVAAKGPKPIYFAGRAECSYNICEKLNGTFPFDYKYGEECTPVSN